MFKSIYGLGSVPFTIMMPTFLPGGFPNNTPISGPCLYHYEITDTDFVENWSAPCSQSLFQTEVRCGAVIACYQNKDDGQFVAYNLALYHRYMQEMYLWYRLEDEIGYNCEYTPWYRDYVEEVKNILTRTDNLKVFW